MKFLSIKDRRRINIIVFIGGIAVLAIYLTARATFLNDTTAASLKITGSYSIAMDELSAMTPISRSALGTEMIAIGDGDAVAKSFIVTKDHVAALDTFNFSDMILKHFALCLRSDRGICSYLEKALLIDWEGIAFDVSQYIFALQEHSGAVVIFHKQDQDPFVINLDFSSIKEPKSDKKQGKKKDDKLGEGLLLLKQGHILIVKENKPAAFIEFAPPGDTAALGTNHDAILKADESFDLSIFNDQRRIVYQPVGMWTFGSKSKCDLSDLATDPVTSELYSVSQKCNLLFKIGTLDPKKKRVDIAAKWQIPPPIRGVESLLVLSNSEFLVGSDHKKLGKPNLFRLSVVEPK